MPLDRLLAHGTAAHLARLCCITHQIWPWPLAAGTMAGKEDGKEGSVFLDFMFQELQLFYGHMRGSAAYYHKEKKLPPSLFSGGCRAALGRAGFARGWGGRARQSSWLQLAPGDAHCSGVGRQAEREEERGGGAACKCCLRPGGGGLDAPGCWLPSGGATCSAWGGGPARCTPLQSHLQPGRHRAPATGQTPLPPILPPPPTNTFSSTPFPLPHLHPCGVAAWEGGVERAEPWRTVPELAHCSTTLPLLQHPRSPPSSPPPRPLPPTLPSHPPSQLHNPLPAVQTRR